VSGAVPTVINEQYQSAVLLKPSIFFIPCFCLVVPPHMSMHIIQWLTRWTQTQLSSKKQ